jgi:hypothetical protein
MPKLTIVVMTLLAAFGSGRPAFAEEAISEPRCVCGLSTGADLLSAGLPTFSDPANTPANERDSKIDGARSNATDFVATPSPLLRSGPEIDR